MHYEEMLTWLLFYTSLLDVAKTPAAGRGRSRRPGAEPGGASRPTAAAHRAQRLAERRERCRRASCPSSSARACSTSPSPPTTSWRRWRRLEANGVSLLPIPENYYDDLEAKTDLAAAQHRDVAAPQHPLRPRRRRASTCRSTRRPSTSGSSSRSSSGAATRLRRRQRPDPPGIASAAGAVGDASLVGGRGVPCRFPSRNYPWRCGV